jgi:hypothetical protein
MWTGLASRPDAFLLMGPTRQAIASAPTYLPGDILVAAADDGTHQVSRVSANGHSAYVLGFQKTQPAALLMAARATSGYQRVFVQLELGSAEYRLVG